MKADLGNGIYDRSARHNAQAGSGHRLAPATASFLLATQNPQGSPASVACSLTSIASRRRSVISTEDRCVNKSNQPMKMKTMKNTLFTVAALVLFSALPGAAVQLPEHHKTLYGEGLCAKCELKETEKCQTAIRVTEGDRKVVYYANDNDVTKAFHSNICKLVEPVKAVGNVQETDGKRHITLTYIEVKEH
jgi:hypothetical protein